MAENKHVGMIALSCYEETTPVERIGSDKRITWGTNDSYPEFLYGIYRKCPTLSSIVNITTRMVMSIGVEDMRVDQSENEHGDLIEDVIEKCVKDILIFGGYAYQVKYNRLGAVISILYIDVRRIRLSSDGTICYVADQSSQLKGTRPEYHKMRLYNPDTAGEDGVQIVFESGSSRGVYPSPYYEGAIPDCETQIQTKVYNYNEINNNFLSSAIMNFNGVVPSSEEEKNKIIKDVNNKLGGAKAAGYIMCFFNDGDSTSGGTKSVTMDRLGSDDLPDRYINISDQSRAEIFISMGAHPQLFGMNTSTGFADIEYAEAMEMYTLSMLSPIKKWVNRSLNKVFKNKQVELL